ncbi:hypothetical protein GT030_19140 [Streptomyces sp. SID1328]|uniref:hypothetical protein n=1 Tax=Streptomyces sp. SID1328 TaxID=2690250 RepID=UPI001395040B|nr:hypothetical protein [Streptomyces sp. SID1328]MYV40924.1 hypothetical protein [Streptomyces sp. SID1328]
MDQGDAARRVRLVREALVLVAASAEEQREWVLRVGVGTDEIALMFDDVWRLGEGLVPGLRAIDEIFEEMSDDRTVDHWSVAALAEDEGWERARVLAREILGR